MFRQGQWGQRKRAIENKQSEDFHSQLNYVTDTKERKPSVDIKDLETNDGCRSGLTAVTLDGGLGWRKLSGSWTILYLGNKTFNWLSNVDLKYSQAKYSWLVEKGYQLCYQWLWNWRTLHVGRLFIRFLCLAEGDMGLKKRFLFVYLFCFFEEV